MALSGSTAVEVAATPVHATSITVDVNLDSGTSALLTAMTPPRSAGGGFGSPLSESAATDAEWQSQASTLRIAFVDDETSNVRLGLRMLGRLGVNVTDNVTVLTDGEESLHPAAAVVAVTVARC